MKFLFLACLLGTSSSQVCPSNYTLIGNDRCVRLLYFDEYDSLNNLLPKAREQCMLDGAHLPIIRNAEENVIVNTIANSMEELKGHDVLLVLDLFCNNSTHRLEWADGSSLEYTPDPQLVVDFDCVQSSRTLFSKPKDEQWYHVLTDYNQGWPFTVLCMKELIGLSGEF